jgi:hypothetical protein
MEVLSYKYVHILNDKTVCSQSGDYLTTLNIVIISITFKIDKLYILR